MSDTVGTKSALSWAVHLSVAALVLLWLFPTVGLLISSFRTADQISASGWWASLSTSEQVIQVRTGGRDAARQEDGVFVVEGNILTDAEDAPGAVELVSYGVSSRAVSAYEIGETAEFGDGETLILNADGTYLYTSVEEPGRRGQRVFVTALLPPDFTTENYQTVLFSGTGQDNMAKAFFNTLTVVIPATIIPILIAAFAAYALAWMEFPGRALLIAAVVGLLVVPLQLALIPLLQLHNAVGIGKGYLGVWLARKMCRGPCRFWCRRRRRCLTHMRCRTAFRRTRARSSRCRSDRARWPESSGRPGITATTSIPPSCARSRRFSIVRR